MGVEAREESDVDVGDFCALPPSAILRDGDASLASGMGGCVGVTSVGDMGGCAGEI